MEAPEKKRDERGRPIAHTRRSPDKNKGQKKKFPSSKRSEWQDQNSSPRAEEWRKFRRRRLVGMYVVSGVVYGIVEVRSVGRI